MSNLIAAFIFAAAPPSPAPLPAPNPPRVVIVDQDNVQITASCTVKVADHPIIDADGNGVIHVAIDGLAIDFAGSTLRGNAPDQLPDSFNGTGVRVTSKNITLSNLNISGFKVGIHATNADGLTIHHCDVSNNFHQRLKSTPQSEDASDWLWPHANDGNEWITNYGAGLCVEDSAKVSLERILARKTQNGIILDRVDDSRVFDCDCSFLSGWGLALWRSNRNVVSRNAFDFCVRGYSHGVYNRGQDSAGILMFEQCCENVIANNSCTHCGDGIFSFAGSQSLGQAGAAMPPGWHQGRGNNGNVIKSSRLSDCVAHGLELTFSFDNLVEGNYFHRNAVCGYWGGYSSRTQIVSCEFHRNGDTGSGLERGGVNIEHGSDNRIVQCDFRENTCGVHLWHDEDVSLLATPWAQANSTASSKNSIVQNSFDSDRIAIHLRSSGDVLIDGSAFKNVGAEIDADPASTFAVGPNVKKPRGRPRELGKPLPGLNGPTSMREELAGRENIIMTEWGPWDHESPLLQFVQRFDHADEYRLLGTKSIPAAEQIKVDGDVFVDIEADRIRIRPRAMETLIPYSITIQIDDQTFTACGLLSGGSWAVKTFPSVVDPREDADWWRNEGLAHPSLHILTCDPLDLRFGQGGMSEARKLPVKLAENHFGCIANRTLTVPAGKWNLATTSDDGLRVWMNEELVIDDWTHHGPTPHNHEFNLIKPIKIDFRVEYFELDGFAVLSVDLKPVTP